MAHSGPGPRGEQSAERGGDAIRFQAIADVNHVLEISSEPTGFHCQLSDRPFQKRGFYFQPGREEFRRALQSAMPKLLTNGQKSPKDEMRDILDSMTAKNWKKGKARLVALLGKL